MIAGFKHKALKRFFETGDPRGINPHYAAKIGDILTVLNSASAIEGVDLPSFRLHPLKGDMKGFWAVTVRANWRIVFKFEDGRAFDVDLVDYH
ncbi:MAG TPA: peptidase [Alphaproteobacteria bacterium]|nr:peptidase [Alphaproteobacteria bacterium]HAJ47096.1 peptidase [Alphaproteobacteria bacterium]